MTIEQLQYFLAIATYHTFSQAALELNMTQSSLSKHIIKLEQELDVKLFDRTHRQISLTIYGQQLLKDAQKIINDHQQMLNNINDLKTTTTQTIKIAMIPIFSLFDFAFKFNKFKKDHPEIPIIIEEIEERDITTKLHETSYDLFIMRDKCHGLEHLHKIKLYDDELIALAPKNASFKSSCSLKELATYGLLLMPRYTTIAEATINKCLELGFKPSIKRHGRIETIIHAAKNNEGIAITTKKSLHIFHLDGLKAIKITDKISLGIYLYYDPHASNSKQINCLLSYIKPIEQ